MKGIISIVVGVLVAGMIVLLCLFSCTMGSIADDYWDDFKREKDNERR